MKAYIFLIENDIYPEYLKTTKDLKGEEYKMSVLVDEKSQVEERSPRREAGLLSTLTQLLSLSSAEEENAQLEKAAHISLARECIDKCQLEKVASISR